MLYPKNVIALLVACLLPTLVLTQVADPEIDESLFCPPEDEIQNQTPGITLLTDQDVFSAFNEDRNYTMGIGLRCFGKRAHKSYMLAPLGRKILDGWFIERPIRRAIIKEQLAQDCEFTQDALDFYVAGFTPLNIAEKAIVPQDRPYACLLGIGSTRGRVYNNGGELSQKLFISSSFYLGVLGTHVGKAVQTHIHRKHWFGSTRPEPEGWGNQISDGGELTFMYRLGVTKPLFEWNKKHTAANEPPTHFFQYSATAELYAGYYTQASLSLNLRMGIFNQYYFQMTDTYSSASNSVPNAQKRRKIRAYIFAQPRARFVLYNALLQGQFAPSVYTLTSKEISRAIFDWNWGLCLSFWRLDLVFVPDAGRTPEFKSPLARNHRWATVYVNYNL
jgi:Uncharacterized protein conserved in bacteria (DUF2219)